MDERLLRCAQLQAGLIIGLIQIGPTPQASHGFGCPNKFEDRFVTDQWLPGPVSTDRRKQSMLDWIPFRGSRRHMSHHNTQPKFVSQLLQRKLPQPRTITVWVAAISFDQQFLLTRICYAPHPFPPPPDGRHSKCGRLMRQPDYHEAFVRRQIVNPKGDRDPVGVTRVIIFQHGQGYPTPCAASLFEVADQLALLRIYANDRLSSPHKTAAHAHQVAHLPIPLRVLLPCQPLAIDTDGIMQLAQQSPDSDKPDFETCAPQGALQCPQRFAGPSDPSDGVTSRGIVQQFFERLQNLRVFFSMVWRPPPGRRTRPAVWRSTRCTSERPRLMVMRLIPLISDRCWMLPWPQLECEQTNEASSVFLIQSCQYTVDGLMFFRHRAIWMLLTGFADTLMNYHFLMLFHWRSSLQLIRQE